MYLNNWSLFIPINYYRVLLKIVINHVEILIHIIRPYNYFRNDYLFLNFLITDGNIAHQGIIYVFIFCANVHNPRGVSGLLWSANGPYLQDYLVYTP